MVGCRWAAMLLNMVIAGCTNAVHTAQAGTLHVDLAGGAAESPLLQHF